MPVEQINPHEIGVVTGLSGEAYAQTASGTRILEPGSPIFQGEELVTGGNGNVEVRFVDDTLISQGSNSRIALDDYVYDPDGGESSFLGDIAEGTFRTVTGKIAEQNPDRFKLGSPLATIGIRGTIILSEVTGDGEKHGVEEIHAGKAMLLQSKATGDIRQLFSGQMVDVGSSGLLSPVRSLSAQERDNFRNIASQNIRQEQEIREQQDDDQKEDDQVDEQSDDQQNDEQQQGEQQDGPKEELPGDVNPGGGDLLGPGGVLPGGEVDGGEKLLVPPIDPQPKDNDHQGPKQIIVPEPQPIPRHEPKPEPVLLDPIEEQETTEQSDDSDNSGDSGSNPHDIHGSGLIKGTAANETITGSSSQDTIYGEGGNDTLYGEAGDDELFGGAGNDSMYGGAGEDMLNGGSGNNYLDGGSGEDHETDFASFDGLEHGVTVDLSNKNDAGEVTVITDDDANTQDVLVNIEGVIGTNYADTLVGDEGVNRFNPLINSDYDGSNMESIDGGDGSDWIQFENIDYGVNITLDHTSSTYAELKDGSTVKSKIKLSNIENVQGSSQADRIIGSDEANTLLGGEGNDFISGGKGEDSIDGGEGTDSLSYDYITAGSDYGIDITLSASGTGTAKTIGASDPEDTFTSIEKIFGSGTHDTFTGSDAADTFDGNEGNDIIYGNSGDDVLAGGAGNDQIYGGAGADSISGGSGADTIYGGDGDDVVSGGAGNNALYGGSSDGSSGADTVSYADHTQVSIVLSDTTSHTIGGNTYSDFLDGFSTYIGSDGNDEFIGDVDGDTFVGGKGNDTFNGGEGTNLFIGGEGIDTISFANSSTAVSVTVQETGNTTVTQSGGKDVFSGVESFIGSEQSDTFNGSSNDETFSGGDGDDIVYAGAGNDTLIGGAGVNRLDGQGGTKDFVSFANASSGMTVTLEGANEVTIGTGIGADIIKNIEGIIGSGYTDNLTGDDNANYFKVGSNDNFNIGTSSTYESVTGGGGSDWVQFDDLSSQYYVVAEMGSDHVYIKDSSNSDVTINKVMLSSIENVLGSSGNDIMTGAGGNILDGAEGTDLLTYAASSYGVTFNINDSDGSVVHHDGTDQFSNFEIFQGTHLADTFNGSDNGETMIGGEGDDTFTAGGGDDHIIAGLGNDSIDGGDGIDTLDYSGQGDAVTIVADIGSGNGTAVYEDSGTTLTDTFTGIDHFIGSTCDDFFTGSDASETFEGGTGTDNINGGGGTDFISFAGLGTGITIDLSNNAEGSGNLCTVTLGGGNDTFKNIEGVIGSNYSDTITASSIGSSTIMGGQGADTINLFGGESAKLIYTSLSEGGDTIDNFTSGEDKLWFNSEEFSNSAELHKVSTYVSGESSEFSDNSACFVYDTTNHQLWYDSNGDATDGNTLIADFTNTSDINSGDFDFSS